MRYKGVTKFMAGLLAAAMVVTGIPVATLDTAEAKSKTEKLSYKGYTKVWEDNFDGNSLNMKDWNVETHEPGWVNAELQEYTESGNIKVSDGKLTIIPKRTKNADGTYSYTSGRINTQNKHDFKYGIMEARMKFPKGQGYLPAFWMMPTNENLYGQWPKCGEIDIAEVMGQDTKKIYGTIHYGEPHAQSQGTEVLKKGNFADDWHTCAVEWEPGSIKWYVDGVLYHEEHSWFTKTPGQGEVTYPAPFDQNFYIIFNLAIGGSWVGYPDKTTDYNSNFQVDYVKVYQKKNYNDNVKKPEKKVVLKKADKKGNFISNADFSKNEKLDGSANWQFMTAQSGEGSAAIKNKKIEIKTKNAGKEEYSIQLVQPGLPMEKGATYEVSFDAYADKARTMKVDISGPDMNYMRYFNDTAVNLTTKKKSYKFKFTMNEDTDANSRLEFNMGAQGSTANVYITNVKVKKVKSATKAEANKKTVLADGNLVYNGKFQEGDKRLGYWNVKKKNATVAVSNKDYNDRKLVVKLTKNSKASDVKVYQTGLAFEANKEYSVSFDANASDARSINVRVAGKTFTAKLNKATKNYEFIMKTGKKLSDKSVIFSLGGKKGTVCIDNVVVTENSLIKNGSFNAGTTGWTEWHDTSEADLSFVIDSLSEDNAADFTIKKTGSEDWKIQLKQENVPLEKDQYYKLTFKAKSSKTREMRAIMQGLEDKGWAVYSGENTVKLTSKYKTYTKVFQMTADSDPKSQISFCLGAVGGKSINTQHRVCIDDVNLEIISEEEAKKYIKKDDSAASEEVAGSLIANGSFNDGSTGWTEWHDTNAADASFTVTDKAADMTINKTGTEDWHVQLKQDGITLTKGKLYRLKFNAKSTKERKIRAIMQGGESKNYEVYSGENIVTVTDKYKTYSKVFEMTSPTDTQVSFGVNFGKVDGKVIDETHHVYIDDVSLVELTDEEAKAYKEKHATNETSWTPPITVTPGPSPSPTSVVSKLTPTQMDGATKTTNGASVSHAPTSTGKIQTKISNNGSGAPADIKDPLINSSSITSGTVNQIDIPIAWAPGTGVMSLRRGRLMSGTTYSVNFAWINDAGDVLEALADADGNETFNIGQTETTVSLISSAHDANFNGKLACFIGGVAANNSVVYGDIKATKMTNLVGPFAGNWQQSGNVQWGINGGSDIDTYGNGGVEFKISNAGTYQWDVQLMIKNLSLQTGATYKYSYTIQADQAWKIDSKAQSENEGANPVGEMDKALEAGQTYTISKDFVAKSDTNMFAIQMGAGTHGSAGENSSGALSPAVKMQVSNLQIVKLKDAPKNTITSATVNIVDSAEGNKLTDVTANGEKFTSPASGYVKKVEDGKAEITITHVGSKNADIEIAQEGIQLEKGAKYKFSFVVTAEQAFSIGRCIMICDGNAGDGNYQPYGSMGWTKEIQAGTQTVEETFVANYEGAKCLIQLGQAPVGKVTLSNVRLELLEHASAEPDPGETPTNLFSNPNFENNEVNGWETIHTDQEGVDGSVVCENGVIKTTVNSIGTAEWMVRLAQSGLTLQNGKTYKLSFNINVTSEASRTIKYGFGDPGNSDKYYAGESKEITNDESYHNVEYTFTVREATSSTIMFYINFGQIDIYGAGGLESQIKPDKAAVISIKDLSLIMTN